MAWRRRFQPFNLKRKEWAIQKFWKHIQRPKTHQKQTFFLLGQSIFSPCYKNLPFRPIYLDRRNFILVH